MSSESSLRLAPHARLRMDVRLGRLAGIREALSEDSGLFDRVVTISGEPGPLRVGNLLMREAVLASRPPANLPIVTFLLSNGAATPAQVPELLGMAVRLSDDAMVSHLSDAGWSPDARQPDDMSALEQASNLAQVKLLKQWRSHLPGSLDSSGSNLLHHLCQANLWAGGQSSALEAAKLLIVGGVDWLLPNSSSLTPSQVCRVTDLAEEIDQVWRHHRAATRRDALSKIPASRSSEGLETPRSPRM